MKFALLDQFAVKIRPQWDQKFLCAWKPETRIGVTQCYDLSYSSFMLAAMKETFQFNLFAEEVLCGEKLEKR